MATTFGVMFGTVGTAVLLHFKNFLNIPFVEAFVNTTLVFLKDTEVVWKPVVDASLVVLKPMLDYALSVVQPFGPMAVAVLDSVVRGMVLFGFLLVKTVFTVTEFVVNVGSNVTTSLQSFAVVTRDFASSLYTVMKGFTYLFVNVIQGFSYVIDSCEMVGLFLRRTLIEGQAVTWNDIYEIAVPFVVVALMMSFVAWRTYSNFVKSETTYKKTDEDVEYPRRSSRLARKRAMMYCSDASSSSLTSKKSSLSTTNL